jgi:NitT/TauT family transport system substrate-binding protein
MRAIRVAFALVVLCGHVTLAHAADKFKAAVGQKGAWDTSVFDFGQRRGFFAEEGIELELLFTDGGAETQQAVISGSVDLGVGAGILGILGAATKGAPVKIISSNFTGASDTFWYARTDSGIKGFGDATGKTAGFSTNGSSSNLVLLRLLDAAGVKARPVPTGNPVVTLTQVMSGQIDIGWSIPPIGFDAIEQGQARIIGRGIGLPDIEQQTVRCLIANAPMLEKRRETVRRAMIAYQRTIDWMYRDPVAIDWFAEGANARVDQARRARDEFYPRTALRLGLPGRLDLSIQQATEYKRIAGPLTQQQIDRMMDILAPAGSDR